MASADNNNAVLAMVAATGTATTMAKTMATAMTTAMAMAMVMSSEGVALRYWVCPYTRR
jgi:hypothetical protein